RHRAGGVLAGGDRHDAVAADEPERGLDADDHVLAGRAEDRSRRLGADANRGEVVADGDAGAGARAAGREDRTAVVDRPCRPRLDARIVRVESVPGLRQVSTELEELEAE